MQLQKRNRSIRKVWWSVPSLLEREYNWSDAEGLFTSQLGDILLFQLFNGLNIYYIYLLYILLLNTSKRLFESAQAFVNHCLFSNFSFKTLKTKSSCLQTVRRTLRPVKNPCFEDTIQFCLSFIIVTSCQSWRLISPNMNALHSSTKHCFRYPEMYFREQGLQGFGHCLSVCFWICIHQEGVSRRCSFAPYSSPLHEHVESLSVKRLLEMMVYRWCGWNEAFSSGF